MNSIQSRLSNYARDAAESLLKEAGLTELDILVQSAGGATVIDFRDGIATIGGLKNPPHVSAYVQLQTRNSGNVPAIVSDIHDDGTVKCLVLGEEMDVRAGDNVVPWEDGSEFKDLTIPVHPVMLGRVVDPLGMAVDSDGPGSWEDSNSAVGKLVHRLPIERQSPGVLERAAVKRPLMTGVTAVDSLYPIAKGQRMLILGDRNTGKTTIALSAIYNVCRINQELNRDTPEFEQHKSNTTYCVYVAIGKRKADVLQIWNQLKKHGYDKYTIIVSASSSDPASIIYIAPFAGCTIAEYFRDRGRDALVVFDDLTRHAYAYRNLSLVLKHPPGREAYPGDIFYLHSRLLDRAGQMRHINNNGNTTHQAAANEWGWRISETHRQSYDRAVDPIEFPCNGSVTALAVAETQEGEFAAYIPTNLVSITDGQIYLSLDPYTDTVLPAVDRLSVSRIGAKGQHPCVAVFSAELSRILELYIQAEKNVHLGVGKKEDSDYIRGQRVRWIFKQTLDAEGDNGIRSFEEQFLLLFFLGLGYFNVLTIDMCDPLELARLILDRDVAERLHAIEQNNVNESPELLSLYRDIEQRLFANAYAHFPAEAIVNDEAKSCADFIRSRRTKFNDEELLKRIFQQR